MAFPVAGSPYPSGSGAASPAYTTRFSPTIWSAKMAEAFYQSTMLARICSTDWDEEVQAKRFGDNVKIRLPPPITVSDYQADGPAQTPQRPSVAVATLALDNGKDVCAALDDVMRVQSDLNLMNIWAVAMARNVRPAIEADFLPQIQAGVPANAKGATAGKTSDVNLGTTGAPIPVASFPGMSESTPVAILSALAQVLDEKGVPASDRWVLAPPWFTSQLEQTPAVIGSVGGGGGYEAGLVCRACRFDVYQTNFLPPTGSAYPILAGHPSAVAFASQLSMVETVRMEVSFGSLVKGLQVSGMDIINADGLALAYASKSQIGGQQLASAFVGSGFADVTPADATVLPPNRGLIVTATGGVVVQGIDDAAPTDLGTLPAGFGISVQLLHVMSATTATVKLVK